MKYCTYCGNELKKGIKFCENCGKKINHGSSKIKTIVISCIIIIIVIFLGINIAKNIKEKRERNAYYKNIESIVKYNLNKEVNNKYSIKFVKTKDCTECTASCDGSCFWHSSVDKCYIHKYLVKENELKYDVFLIDKANNINNKYYFYSRRNNVIAYNNAINYMNENFSDFKIESNFTNSVSNIDNYEYEANIKLIISKDFDDIFNEELYNKLMDFVMNDTGLRIGFRVEFKDYKGIEFGNKIFRLYSISDNNRRIYLCNKSIGDDFTYNDFMIEVNKITW